jgi:predicted peptidase
MFSEETSVLFPAAGISKGGTVVKLVRVVAFSLLAAGLGGEAAPGADTKPSKAQQEKHLEKEVLVKVVLNYLLFLPEEYGKADKAWPMLLFLHGAGESGNDLELVKKHGPPKIAETKRDFPFIVASPQSPRGGWVPHELITLVDEVASKYKVDPDRIYVTGLSMGGFGTWSLAAAYPDRFAAIVPICGGNPADAKRLQHLPIWVFHGAKDRAVPLARSEAMVKALKAVGSNVKFTIYPNAEHDSWTETYNNPELYKWLLQQKRGAANSR